MHAPSITLTGNVAATPVLRRTAADVPVVSFRIANTPSRLDRTTGAWTDLELGLGVGSLVVQLEGRKRVLNVHRAARGCSVRVS